MDVENWRRKQNSIEHRLETIELHRVCLFIGIGLLCYSVFMILVFSLNNINVITCKGIPLLAHPVFLIFISICSFIMYIIEEKMEDVL